MKMKMNKKEISLSETGVIRTSFDIPDAKITDESNVKITEEFYPYCAGTIQTKVESITIQPHTFKRRVIKNES